MKIPFDILSPLLAGSAFVIMMFLQLRSPLRRQNFPAVSHAVGNFIFALPGFVLLRLFLIPIPIFVAQWASQRGLGLLNLVSAPPLALGILGFFLLDLSYYWWHVATHKVPFLWRFHAVHHTDLDLDVSTAARFHWGEILLSVILRVTQVAFFGVSVATLLAYEIVFECAAQFHHSNWKMNERIERNVNRVFVTPRMHGIHHSMESAHLNSNWGTVFSFWDKVHGTHRMDEGTEIIVGLPESRDARTLTPLNLWKMPFARHDEDI